MMKKNRPLRVFLCHASVDKPAVREIYERLKSESWIDPWLDSMRILPGQDWSRAIGQAVEETDAVIVFVSKNSVSKEGFVQKEINYTLEIASEKPEGSIFIIPARLDDKSVPPRRLSRYQWINLFEPDSYDALLKSLQSRSRILGLTEQEAQLQYDLDNVNEMLRALSEEQLKSLVYEELPSLFSRINWGGFAFKRISDIIFFAQERNQLTNLLSWVSKNAPHIYKRYFESPNVSIGEIQNIISVAGDVSGSIIGARIEGTRRLSNPYVTGNPIQPNNSRVFWGRLDIAESIVNEIKGSIQKPSFLLYGRRRMGKTSALLNLRKLIKGIKLIDVFISGQNAKYREDEDFCYYLTLEIIKTTKKYLLSEDLSEELFDGQNEYADKSRFRKNPALALTIFLEKIHDILDENDVYCLLMVDEYEELNKLSRELLMQIRDTLQHMPRIGFLFAGVRLLSELPNSYWGEVFVNVRTLKISFLNRSDGRKLLTEPVPELIYESPKIIEKILDITGCQPFLIQTIGAELVNTLNFSSKTRITNIDLSNAIKKVVSTWKNYFDGYLWQQECRSSNHQFIIKELTMNTGVKVSKLHNYSSEIDDLIEKDLVIVKNGKLYLTMPILGIWLKSSKFVADI